jgi:glycosyltransferase involved in cell wall biosynthesis
MPVLEAMNCGTPAIAPRGSAFPEIISPVGMSLLVVNPLEPASVADAMQFVQSMPPDELESLGHMAKNRAREFSWKTSARSMLEVYEQVTSSPKLFVD